jgi:GAF domain-containing protein
MSRELAAESRRYVAQQPLGCRSPRMDKSAQKTIHDYILSGQYCEPSAISERVGAVRQAADAHAALLIAWRGRTLFHSLLTLETRDPADGRHLRQQLFASPFQPGAADPPWAEFDPVASDPKWLLDRLAATPPFNAIASLLADTEARVIRKTPRTEQSLRTGITPASILVLIMRPRIDVESRLQDEAAEDLLLMVNASAPAVVQGNLAAEHRVEEALAGIAADVQDSASSQASVQPEWSMLHDLPQTVLEIALKLAAASVGNVYLEGRDTEELELAGAVGNERPYQRIDVTDRRSVVAWVYRRRRPLVINDIRDFQRMYPAERYLSVTGGQATPYAELAVPIFQSSPARAHDSVIGVINVEKARRADGTGDAGFFTYRDLAMLRSAASQLSLWRSHALLTTFSRSLARLTRRSTVTTRDRPSALPAQELGTDVPVDALGARDTILDTLRSVYEVTRSHSATVRLISPDQRGLVRFAAYPRDRAHDPHGRIGLLDPASVNAWVARHGRECYVGNFKAPKPFAAFPGLQGALAVRERTQSELCLPIFVSGRLVGVLNLESAHRDAYDDALEMARAIVEQVGLALAQARRDVEQGVYSLSIATTANLHQVYRHVGRLRDRAVADPDLADIAGAIENAVDAEPLMAEDPIDTAELVQTILSRLNFENIFHVAGQPPVRVTHSGQAALILRVAFEELFRNAHRAAVKKSLRGGYVRWGEHTIGGRRYLSARIGNPLARRLHPAEAVLFRAPVRYRSGRQHIGAFMSAALVRSLGGEIWVAHAEPPDFVARVDLPIAATTEERQAA